MILTQWAQNGNWVWITVTQPCVAVDFRDNVTLRIVLVTTDDGSAHCIRLYTHVDASLSKASVKGSTALFTIRKARSEWWPRPFEDVHLKSSCDWERWNGDGEIPTAKTCDCANCVTKRALQHNGILPKNSEAHQYHSPWVDGFADVTECIDGFNVTEGVDGKVVE